MHIVCSIQNGTGRRFRLKVSPGSERNSVDECRDCIDHLSTHFPIKVQPLEGPLPDSQQVSPSIVHRNLRNKNKNNEHANIGAR